MDGGGINENLFNKIIFLYIMLGTTGDDSVDKWPICLEHAHNM